MSRLKNPEAMAPATLSEFEAMRGPRNLRLVTAEEDGTGSEQLPNSVYGFTYSPAEDNFPIFQKRELRSYEAHKTADGEVFVIGFLSDEERQKFDGSQDAVIHLFPEPRDAANKIVSVSMKRLISRAEYSQRAGKGLEMRVRGA